MMMKIMAFISLALVLAAATIPATGQMPGRNTPLTDDDAQILQLAGNSYGNTMGGRGSRIIVLTRGGPGIVSPGSNNKKRATS